MTTVVEPVPIKVPPQEPVYQFQEALVPNDPPATVRLTKSPEQTELFDAKDPKGSEDSVSTFIVTVSSSGGQAPPDTEYVKSYAPPPNPVASNTFPVNAPVLLSSFHVPPKSFPERVVERSIDVKSQMVVFVAVPALGRANSVTSTCNLLVSHVPFP